MIERRTTSILITIFTKVALALGSILAKLFFKQINPYTFTAFSLAIGTLGMLFYTFVIKKEHIDRSLMTRRVWWIVVQIGVCMFVLGSLGTLALNYMSANTNSFLQNLVSLVTIVLSVIILKEKPSRVQVFGALVVLAGVYIFFPARPKGSELVGVIMVLISITAMAYYNNISRKLTLETDGKLNNNVVISLAMLIGGGLGSVLFLAYSGWDFYVPNWQSWLVILYFGLIVRALGMALWNMVLRNMRSYEVSLIGATYVIWATLIAVLILHEKPLPQQIVGIAVLLVGLVMVQLGRTEVAGKPSPMPAAVSAADAPTDIPGDLP